MNNLAKVVAVRFRRVGKPYHFDPAGIELEPGDRVVVETARGLEIGEVVCPVREVPDDQLAQPLKPVLRVATEADLGQAEENQALASGSLRICREKVGARGLPMHVLDAEYTLDRSRLVFYFASETRVDFRELVRDLASSFRTRIELRQVGVRDEAKMVGGLGPCGREVCCAVWLSEFQPVSIRMAKVQNLSLNPGKISGLCGRLMCCLRYEADLYRGGVEEEPEDKEGEEPGDEGEPGGD
ncbi:MAG: stage 0 sporulation family protein [Bacillota bacterium]|nr:stage 0 sporulation family protein [Bacillota bacterium]